MNYRVKKLWLFLTTLLAVICGWQLIGQQSVKADSLNSNYQMIAHAQDWGPAIDQVIIQTSSPIKSTDLNAETFKVNSSNTYIKSTARDVTNAYLSDEKGNKVSNNSSRYVTLELKIDPTIAISNPFYFHNDDLQLNTQVKVQFDITQQNPLYTSQNKKVTDIAPVAKSSDVSYPEAKNFSKNYRFNYDDKHFGKQTLQYTYYQAPTNNKHALIIWLHGAGEGGSDPNPVSLFGNRVVALSQKKIQSHFINGADVLVPQAKTFWLDTRINSYANKNDIGSQGRGTNLIDTSTPEGKQQRSRYEDSLAALIQSYLSSHPNIDRSKIYIGGCSNGGYMALRMLIKDPSKYTAAFPISEAYMDENISDQQIAGIKDSSIWFTQAANDPVVDPLKTTLPTYQRLMKENAKDVHFSYPNDVHDQTGLYQTDGQPYQYMGHWSWINVLDDYPAPEYGEQPSGDTTVMSWLATKQKATTWK